MNKELPDVIKQYIENDRRPVAKGYIRFLSAESSDKMRGILGGVEMWNGGVPFATTVFGEILSWEDGYVVLYDFSQQDYNVILSGINHFFSNIEDGEYQKDTFDIQIYEEAMENIGEVKENECYAVEPIPLLGGKRELRYLHITNLLEYLQMLVA